MYKVSSDKAQSKAHRGKLADWVDGEQMLTDEQRRDSLVTKVKALQSCHLIAKEAGEDSGLGPEIARLCKQINEIRPKPRVPEAKDHFIDAARELLSKAEFSRILKLATIRATNTCVDE